MTTELNVKYACMKPCSDFTRNTGKQQNENIQITTTSPAERPNHCKSCFNTNFPLLFEPKELCRDKEIKLVIFITSVTSERRHRDVIRQTWLSVTKNNSADVRYFFILGKVIGNYNQEIHNEHIENNDIVMYDFIDTYNNLTLKTMQGFRYATSRCSQAKYVMKTDMDVYVNLHAILSNLLTTNKTGTNVSRTGHLEPPVQYKNYKSDYQFGDPLYDKQEMFGLLWHETVPYRNSSKSKWFVSADEYSEDFYPDYFDGHGYVFSMRIAQNVEKISKSVPFFKFEDVYVGMCLKKLGYPLIHTQGFMRIDKDLTLCSHKFQHVYTVHRVSINKMRRIWNATCPLYGLLEEEISTKKNHHWLKVYVKQERNNVNTKTVGSASEHQTVKVFKFSYVRQYN
ncbi:beta-1,3-galactosyltransferase 1-like [Ruditapes philippinarum]|uniref:beta-1,3-galactosyltransferase 1-like n=1 Tax=Ruditapes philippinarum TaxID=129788 RepID=UPI00295AB166|nr:beta-1,3-galactosyltransferase 1-like [Ruditapes philippinarum]